MAWLWERWWAEAAETFGRVPVRIGCTVSTLLSEPDCSEGLKEMYKKIIGNYRKAVPLRVSES